MDKVEPIKVELTEWEMDAYVNDLPEILFSEVLWRENYFKRIIEKAQEQIDKANLILQEIAIAKQGRQE